MFSPEEWGSWERLSPMPRPRTVITIVTAISAFGLLVPPSDAVDPHRDDASRAGVVHDGWLRVPRIVTADQPVDVSGSLDRRGARRVELQIKFGLAYPWTSLVQTRSDTAGAFRFADVVLVEGATPVGTRFWVRAFAPKHARHPAIATPQRRSHVDLARPDMSGPLTIASVSSAERLGDGYSGWGEGTYSVSGTGRYVAFETSASWADPLRHPGPYFQVFVRDRGAGKTILVSRNRRGTEGEGHSRYAVISGDGRWVLFSSTAPGLAANDRKGVVGLYAWDRENRRTTAVTGVPLGRGGVSALSVSADGRFVAFSSTRPDLPPQPVDPAPDLYVIDRTTGVVEQLPTPPTGPQYAERYDVALSMSDDGRFVAYAVNVPDPDGGSQYPYNRELRYYDRELGTTRDIPAEPSGERPPYDDVSTTAMTSDGQQVAFVAPWDDPRPGYPDRGAVFIWDASTGTAEPVPESISTGIALPDISADGRYISGFGGNGTRRAVRIDRETGAVVDTTDLTGIDHGEDWWPPLLSDDGSTVVVGIYSDQPRFILGDTNKYPDVFAWEPDAG